MKRLIITALLVIALLFPIAAKSNADEGDLLAGILKLGIGAWGLSQKTAYGYVSGSIFLISGSVNILTFRY